MTTATQATADITDLVVNSKENCYQLFSQGMNEIFIIFIYSLSKK